MGDLAYGSKDFSNAYVYYFKGCNMFTEILRKHSMYKSIREDPTYLTLRKQVESAIPKLEEIESLLKDRPQDDDSEKVSQRSVSSSTNSLSSSVSYIDELPAVPTHAPIIRKSPLQPPQHPPPPVPATKPAWTSPHVQPPPSPRAPSVDRPLTVGGTVVPQLQSNHSASSSIPLPSLTKNTFPLSPIIRPDELAKLLGKRDDPPSILLLDIRPRDVYKRGCICHKWVVQLEPMVLKRDVTSRKIEESLVLAWESEQIYFVNRHKFDLIVYYDQSSTNISLSLNEPLRNLKAAIYENEFSKMLQRVPVMLVGGFDAWVKQIGSKGVHVFPPTTKQPQTSQPSPSKDQENIPPRNHEKQLWLKNVVGKTEDVYGNNDSINRTVMDYFNKQGDGSNAQSMVRSNAVKRPKPPMQGVFGQSTPNEPSTITHMPIPEAYHPKNTLPTPSEEEFQQRYPDVSSNSSSMPQPAPPGLTRRNTFIDNPFHGFTSTDSNLYDAPPTMPVKPVRPLPPPPITRMPEPNNQIAPRPTLPRKPLITGDKEYTGSTVEQQHGQAPMSQSSFSQLGAVMIGTTGLKNLGNTCYMNSIIQCLSGTIPLARYFLSGKYKNYINKTNHMGTGGMVADAFANLIRIMWSESYNFYSPVLFRNAIIRFAPQFEGSEQHDSQEFLNFLLDGLHEDLNVVQRRPPPTPEDPEQDAWFEKLPDWEASGIAWEKYLKRNSSVIVSLFQGQFRNRLQCMTCHTTSTTYNSFMTLSLPIPASRRGPSQVTLQQCIDYFVREEILEKDDAWHCPKCKALRKATKQLTLSRLPDVLMIHLKRFSFDGPFNDKLETMVDFPIHSLDLSGYMPSWATKTIAQPDGSQKQPSFKYDLYAVSNHYGSLTGGHYTACVRNGYRGQWHLFDDSRFSVCDDSSVKSRAAYGLFYVRSTIQ
ncbi:unnamed protein product [Umbelopsis ramanniana]